MLFIASKYKQKGYSQEQMRDGDVLFAFDPANEFNNTFKTQ